MAAQTLTVTANVSPKAVPRVDHRGGVTSVSFAKNTGATKFGTIGDVMLLAKIPNKARILHTDIAAGILSAAATVKACLYRVSSVGGSGTLGTLAELADVIATCTIATGQGPLLGAQLHPVVSLSEDNAVQFAVLALKVLATATESVSFSIDGAVLYETGGNDI